MGTLCPVPALIHGNMGNCHGHLDLSYVNISSEIPQMISNLTSLRSIRLQDCHLFGRLPRSVLLSPTIQSIDLSINPYLESSLPEFNGNNSLLYLDLSETSLSGNIPHSIINLKHLKVLKFYGCKFTGKTPSSIGNLSHLITLDLGSNYFDGEIPSSFQNLNRITHLMLGDNKLSGKNPTALFNLTKLSFLSLASNQFTGTLPPNLTSVSNLNIFDASSNSFFGTIPSTFFTIPSLESFILKDNHLNGPLEIGNISSMSNLQILDLSQNNLTGAIPRSISKLINLVYLDLSYFNTRGPLDVGIFLHLKSLEDLRLSHLNTTTTIDLNAVLSLPLKSLSSLDLSGNHVSLENMSSVSTLSSQLQNLLLSGCGITVFPEFIRSLQYIFDIDLSNNNIKGQVPAWLWRLPHLTIVHLSNNSISSFKELPKDLSRRTINVMDVSKNNFSGEIPRSICDMNSLGLVDLSNNNFNGSVPQCLSNLIKRGLSVLNLGNNHLSGKLPDIFLNGSNLRSLSVGHNQLVGKLPRSLLDCSSLEVLSIEHNRMKDTFPFWLESLPKLHILVLRSNEFHGTLQYHPKVAPFFPQLRIIDISHNDFTGTLPSDFFMYWTAMHSEGDLSELEYIGNSRYYQDSIVLMNKGMELTYNRIFKLLTAIDLSGNRLQGIIPESIGQVKSLIVFNLSSNGFVGNIPSSLANLKQLESLDLSHNKLSGHIPPDLGQLTSLSFIRVSHNKLVGMIPKGTQFDTQNVSGFEDNVGLCGPPLDVCGVGHDDPPLSEQGEEDEKEEVLSWIAAAIGFAPGILLGLIIGHFMLLYKPHWFFKVFHINDRRGRRITPRPRRYIKLNVAFRLGLAAASLASPTFIPQRDLSSSLSGLRYGCN
ncbi:hypothetical protein Bca4012_084430 [Brassica carinata]